MTCENGVHVTTPASAHCIYCGFHTSIWPSGYPACKDCQQSEDDPAIAERRRLAQVLWDDDEANQAAACDNAGALWGRVFDLLGFLPGEA